MLTPEQIEEVKREMIPNGVPVRFLINGCATNIVTGEQSPKGTNVIHHVVYWAFTRETAKKIADWIGAKPVFSD
jgi:hypothetical protein